MAAGGGAETIVVRREGLQGVGMFLRGQRLIVSIPPSLAALEAKARMWSPDAAQNPLPAAGEIGLPVEKIVGPAFVGYSDRSHFRPIEGGAARVLDPVLDLPAWEALKAACDATQWRNGGDSLSAPGAVGVFCGHDLAAFAGYEIWGGTIAHISIITDPRYRGRGCGKQAVSAITRLALDRGLVPQYRTLDSNTPAIAIAQSLGFERYSTTVWIKIPVPQ